MTTRRFLAPAVTLGVACVLVAHFVLTGLYVMPLNPVKTRVAPTVNAYMQPYFTQYWELFAPDPVVDSQLLLVSCRFDENGAPRETPPEDVTSPLEDQHHHLRFTPALWLTRAQLSPTLLAAPSPDNVIERLEKLPDPDEVVNHILDEAHAERQEQQKEAIRLFARVASAECDRMLGGERASAVHPVLVAVSPPPFSKRSAPLEDGKIHHTDLGWLPYERVAQL